MSKSLGNVLTVRELLADTPGEAVRLALLQAHYRAPLDFGPDTLAEAKAGLDRLYRALRDAGEAEPGEPAPAVLEALLDDLNTPAAIAAMHETATALNRSEDAGEKAALAGRAAGAQASCSACSARTRRHGFMAQATTRKRSRRWWRRA